mmetsp:Transcript_60896/g.154735  ORF Transcript_60896/g.154735 Transcript_60896/m.154735 type:complete len:209 (-) Transcript_60896:408-1034(-)
MGSKHLQGERRIGIGPRVRNFDQEASHQLGNRWTVAVCRDRRVALRDDAVHQPQQRLGLEGMPQDTHLVEHATQRPHVTLVIVGLPLADLGRHVVRRPQHRHRDGRSVVQHPGDAKVTDLHNFVIPGQQHVGGLQVPMENLEHVRVGDAVKHLSEEAKHAALGQILLAPGPVVQPHPQIATVEVLHDCDQGLRLRATGSGPSSAAVEP